MKKIICIILLLLAMIGMFYFSSQDGETSSKQSQTVVTIIDNMRDKTRGKISIKDERVINLKNKVYEKLRAYDKYYIIRKFAHFFMYFIIGAFMMIACYLFIQRILLSASMAFILTILYSIFDEFRQLFVNGRSGNIEDVFIDSSGAFTSILVISIILLASRCIKFIFNNLNKKVEKDLNIIYIDNPQL